MSILQIQKENNFLSFLFELKNLLFQRLHAIPSTLLSLHIVGIYSTQNRRFFKTFLFSYQVSVTCTLQPNLESFTLLNLLRTSLL